MNDILRKASTYMKADLEKRGVSIKLELADNLPWFKGDYDQLYQALMNIIVNGAQSMPQGGVLTIVTRLEDISVVVEIADEGCGMTEEELEQAFNPFYTTKNRGTGLGLAIVKNIVDHHDGKITVQSHEGQGTLFRVEFPVPD
jgi:signal transduction histidine kinase